MRYRSCKTLWVSELLVAHNSLRYESYGEFITEFEGTLSNLKRSFESVKITISTQGSLIWSPHFIFHFAFVMLFLCLTERAVHSYLKFYLLAGPYISILQGIKTVASQSSTWTDSGSEKLWPTEKTFGDCNYLVTLSSHINFIECNVCVSWHTNILDGTLKS